MVTAVGWLMDSSRWIGGGCIDCPRAGPEDRGPRSGGPGQKLADWPPVKRSVRALDLSKVIYTDQQ